MATPTNDVNAATAVVLNNLPALDAPVLPPAASGMGDGASSIQSAATDVKQPHVDEPARPGRLARAWSCVCHIPRNIVSAICSFFKWVGGLFSRRPVVQEPAEGVAVPPAKDAVPLVDVNPDAPPAGEPSVDDQPAVNA